jgi:D-serine deaminase-like pyridoxal phosphate-dependent protein
MRTTDSLHEAESRSWRRGQMATGSFTAGLPLESLDTPALLLDLDNLEANIREMVDLANAAGLRLRPHTKIHESAEIARMQLAAGACGISTAKLAEAEAMAEAGMNDVMVVHPFYGPHKLDKLQQLLRRPELKLTLTVDMFEQASAISDVVAGLGKQLPVLIKLDTGTGRFGCPPGQPTLSLARRLSDLPGVRFAGIVAHEIAGGERTPEGIERVALEVASITSETARLLKGEGIPAEHVIIGASPTFRATCRNRDRFPELTEIHPGAMAIGDVMHMDDQGTPEERCALTVLVTVVSAPNSDRAMIDAGMKTMGNDPLQQFEWKPDYLWDGRPSYGRVVGGSELWLGRMTSEIGVIFRKGPGPELRLGDRLQIIPNSATLTIALHDELFAVRQGMVEKVIAVTGRGKGN